MSKESQYPHPHTIFLHFLKMNVKNLHETPVLETQLHSRSMVKAFTVAASRARSLYGVRFLLSKTKYLNSIVKIEFQKSVEDLEKPIVVQSIQLKEDSVQFGVFQLNTLNIDGVDGTKNVWYNGPTLQLFSDCMYKLGRPVMTGYNPEVFRHIYGFYKNN